jgi:putative Mn2+ efflux pump MntP
VYDMIMLALTTGGLPTMIELPSWAAALILSALGVMIALLGFIFNRQKDTVMKAKEEGALMSEMKYLGRTIEALSLSMCSKFGEVEGRVKILEIESIKRVERLIPLEMKTDAFGKKLDNHEERIIKIEGKEG